MILLNPYSVAAVGPPTFSGSFSYANTDGQGDRRGSITCTGTFSQGSGDDLIDGSTTNLSTKFTNASTGNSILFVFSDWREIDELSWDTSATSALGTWVIECSADGSSWTEIKSAFSLGGSASAILYSMTAQAVFKQLRMRQTGGTTSGTPFMQEVKFRIRNS